VTSALVVEDLTVRAGQDGPAIVEDVSFTVEAGEILGVVGESGSGKTTLGLAILGYGRDGAVITGGDIRINDRSIVHSRPEDLRRLRGDEVSYMPQDPGSSLNPARRIGAQLREVLELKADRVGPIPARIASAMDEVHLPTAPDFLKRYPHELSGGQQQRVLLALAFLRDPRVVVLDEPTTGLDVTTQARVLETVREMCHHRRSAAVYISHDLDVVADLASQMLVLYGGRVAEHGQSAELFAHPRHRYTAALLASAPALEDRRRLVGIPGQAPRLTDRTPGCRFSPRCAHATAACDTMPAPAAVSSTHTVLCHHPVLEPPALRVNEKHDQGPTESSTSSLAARGVRAAYGSNTVLHGVDLEVQRGECLAIVGESGSGKTTLSQVMSGLHAPSGGAITLVGRELAGRARDRSAADRRAIQYVFQNPHGSLNPRKTIRALLEQPARAFRLRDTDATKWLERVRLGPHVLRQRPRQLSGGERQRVAIARALMTGPDFLICDEITSALDVSIQASVINLLQDLQQETGIGIVFVTHNLPLVSALADRVVVMQHGAIVEEGPTEQVLHAPRTAYTQQLLAAVPGHAGPGRALGDSAENLAHPVSVTTREVSHAAPE
jgi:peptide/nickel transport system ATP-binding protein